MAPPAAIAEHSIAAARSSSAAARGWECADPLAMAVALRPHLVTESKRVRLGPAVLCPVVMSRRVTPCAAANGALPQVYVQVELGPGLCRAMSVIDHNGTLKKPPNVTLITSLQRTELYVMLERSLEA